MFPHLDTVCRVHDVRRREFLAAAARQQLVARSGSAPRRRATVDVALPHSVVAALNRVSALVPDSRDGLRSQEQELAAYGIRWPTRLADDRALAQEVQAARQRRRVAAASVPLAPARPAPSRGTAMSGLRGTIRGVLADIGERLHVAPHPSAAGVVAPSGD